MANDVIDTLSLEINSSAKNAYASIDALLGRLNKLNGALNGINTGRLNSLSTSVSRLGQSVSTFTQNVKTADFTRIASGLNKLATVDFSGLANTAGAIHNLSNSLTGLNGISFDAQGLTNLINGVSKLGRKTVTQAAQNIPQLTTALSGLVTQLNSIGTINFDLTSLSNLVSSVSRLGGKNAGNAPQNMQNIANGLKNMMATLSKAPRVSNNVIRLAEAMGRISSNGSRAGAAARSLSSNIRSFGNSATKTEKKTRSLALSIGKLVAAFYAIKRIGKGLFESVENSMNYLETFNYFNAAFNQVADKAAGEWQEAGYKSAEEYANSFSKRARELTAKMTGFNVADNGLLAETGGASLGMDANMLLNYQATFGQISSSMGVASENALRLSDALTMIGADLASVRNEDFSKVYDNLTSGIVGMSRAVDKYGVNIRVANLEQQAQALGINASVSAMSQADKALLRTITILDSTRYAWADLSKTINMPANQIRLLKQNFVALSRSIGNIFLPIVAKVLPYLNAMTIALRRLFEFIGKLLGVDKTIGDWGSSVAGGSDALSDALDSLDTDVPTDGVDNLSDSLSNAKDKAKELEKRLASWDELEVINPKQDSVDDYKLPSIGDMAADAGLGDYSDILGGALDDILSEYEKAWNDAFNSLDNKAVKIANEIEKAFKSLAKTAKPTTEAIKKLWNEGLKKLGNFTWDTIKDFWNNFLKPMGTWMLSDDAGLPRFFNITNDLLNEIEWDRLNTSLENFFTSLQKPAKFVWTSLMDFYEKFLKPISVWTMSEAIPDLVDALTDFNDKIKWDEINEALSNFWEALEPFAESVGRGLVNFFKDLLSVGADFINATVPDGLNSLADAIKKISPETAEKIGEGIGKIALALAGFKGLNKISQLFDKKGAIGKIFVELAKHPYFTIASGVLAVVGALDNFGIIEVDWEFLYNKFKDIKDILADFVDKIDWQTIKDGIGKFWSAFQPFAEGFADGFIDALDKIVNGIGAPLINGIASAFEKLASALDMLPDDMLEGIGKGLGEIAAALLAIKGAKSAIKWLGELGAFKGLGSGTAAAGAGSSAGAGTAGGAAAAGGAAQAAKTAKAGKGLLDAFKSFGMNAGGTILFQDTLSGIAKQLDGTAKKSNEAKDALGLVAKAMSDVGIEGDTFGGKLGNALMPVDEFTSGGATEFLAAFDEMVTRFTNAGGSADELKAKLSTALSENTTLSQEYASAIQEYIGGTGDTFTTAATEYETASAQMQTATSGISGMLQSISDNSWGADQQLSLVAGALQSLSDKGLLSNPQLSTLNEMLLNAQNSGGGLAPILQNLSDELYNAGINAPTFFDALKDGSYYVGDKLPSDFSTFIGSLQNVKTEADNASTATQNVGTSAFNSIGNLVSFIAQAGFMAGGLGSIKTGSEEAGTKISELSGNIVNFVNGLATNAQTVFDEGKKTGENYPAGFAQGIEGKNQDVKDASQEMVDTATDTVKTGLDINSPSGVAEGFGENYGQGLINGIKAKLTDLGTVMDSVIDKLKKPFDNLAQNFQTVGKNLMVSLQNGINSQHISLPRISVSWTKYFMGNSQFSIPNFSLSYLAKGGLITDEMLAIMGENRRKEAVLPLENQKTMSMIADAIVDRMPQRLDIGNIEINRSQAPYVTTANIPRSTYSDSFGDDMRRDIAAISSNTFNNNTNIGQAVKEALNGMAVVADGYIIGYLQSKNMESRNQNGGLGIFEV